MRVLAVLEDALEHQETVFYVVMMIVLQVVLEGQLVTVTYVTVRSEYALLLSHSHIVTRHVWIQVY